MENPFLQTLRSGRVLLMDGAMGTELQRAGVKVGECYEQWNLTHPDAVLAIHRAYVEAGAEVLLTNTFQAISGPLIRRGLLQQIGDIWQAAVKLAQEAATTPLFLLASLGPGEWRCSNTDRGCFYAFQSTNGLLLETLDALHTVRSCIAAQQQTLGPKSIPVLVSATFRHDDAGQLTTFSGHSPEAIAQQACETHGIAALGVNCGREIDMDDVIEIIQRYRTVTDLPLFARSNAGTPTKVDGHWVYPRSPQQMAAKLPELLEAGVAMVGGCCGTTPAHIKAFRQAIDDWNAVKASSRGA